MVELNGLDLTGIPDTIFQDTDKIEWQPSQLVPEISFKSLWRSPDDTMSVSLVHMERRTGAVHYHEGPVFAWTLEGRWRYLEHDGVATAGSFVYEPPNSVHTIQVVEPFTAIFYRTGRIIHFDDDGNPLGDATAPTLAEVLERIRAMPSGNA